VNPNFSTTGVRDVGEFIEIRYGTWETHIFLFWETGGVSKIKPSTGERLEMGIWESESIIVVMKGGNAPGAKGWRINMTGKEKQ